MDFRKYLQTKSFAGALSALTLAAGMTLSSGAFAGGPYVTITDPADLEVITVYTPGAAAPTSMPLPVEVDSSDGNTPDVSSVAINVDGNGQVSATELAPGDWFGVVNLINATDSDLNPFTATINAIGTVPAYYTDPAFSVTDDITVDVEFLDLDGVDSNDDGDPVPDDAQVKAVLEGGGNLVQGTTITQLASAVAGDVEVGGVIALPGGRFADVRICVSQINNVAGPFGPEETVQDIVVMATVSATATQVAGGSQPAVGIDVTGGGAVQRVYVRLVVLIEEPLDTWTLWDSPLPGGTDFLVKFELLNGTAITDASVFGFDVERNAGVYEMVTDAVWEEIDPAVMIGTRATLVSDSEVEADLADPLEVIAFLTTGGAAIPGAGGGGSNGGTCFIATAAYGTPMAQEIDTLRSVRDTYMLNNVAGSMFVDTYYRLSPAIADQVAQSPMLAAFVRALLTPVVMLGKLILAAPMALMGLMLAGAGLVLAHRKARSHQS